MIWEDNKHPLNVLLYSIIFYQIDIILTHVWVRCHDPCQFGRNILVKATFNGEINNVDLQDCWGIQYIG